MERVLETERLYLRRFLPKDATALLSMNNNPKVMQYTGDVAFKNIHEAEQFITNYNPYDQYQMGRWAVCCKKQGAFLGWCGLKYHPEENYVDLGYRFMEKHWKKGYATEACKGVISYAFNKLRIQNIYVYAQVKNEASIKVALKSGLQFIEQRMHENNLTNIYHIKNSFVFVKEITALTTHPVRHKVLRQGKPIESCIFTHDELDTTFHIGLYYYDELIGVASFMKNSHDFFSTSFQYQLRGMAILQQFQGKKFGQLLLNEAFKILKNKGIRFIWCNARESAVNFYTDFGFETIGDSFQIPEIGTHFVMHTTTS